MYRRKSHKVYRINKPYLNFHYYSDVYGNFFGKERKKIIKKKARSSRFRVVIHLMNNIYILSISQLTTYVIFVTFNVGSTEVRVRSPPRKCRGTGSSKKKKALPTWDAEPSCTIRKKKNELSYTRDRESYCLRYLRRLCACYMSCAAVVCSRFDSVQRRPLIRL